jgi:PAS domain S-box-containing protein
MVVPDALTDSRFKDNSLVTGDPHIRYYCGVPLITPEGYRLGSLCVIDQKPRELDHQQLLTLELLAKEVMARLELKRQKREIQKEKECLENSQKQLKTLFEYTAGFLLTHDRYGTILSVNPAAAHASGFGKRTLEGKNISLLLGSEHKERLEGYLRKVKTGQPVSGVVSIRTASGTEKHWLFQNFWHQEQGEDGFAICSAHDITTKEEALRLLQQLNQNLRSQVLSSNKKLSSTHEELNRTKGELDSFLYRSSHDLQGPLCTIKGLLQLARTEKLAPALEQYFTMLSQSLNKLEHVLTNMRSQFDNNQQEIETAGVDFDALIAGAVKECSQLKGFSRVSLRVTTAEGKVPFASDPVRLRTILKCLIANGIVFQNYSDPDPEVQIYISTSPEKAHIVVSDNGIGIPPERLDSIFELFQRSSTQSQGAGLGLYLVREALKKLGGAIRVQSLPGTGSSFEIEVPNCLNSLPDTGQPVASGTRTLRADASGN